MVIDYNKFELLLAHNKVYDAWPFVMSLRQNRNYMDYSCSILQTVYKHRVDKIKEIEQEIHDTAFQNKRQRIPFTVGHTKETYINVFGDEISYCFFLRKTVYEFFHYARISIDLLAQITNAALFGDEKVSSDEKNLIGELTKKLQKVSEFSAIYSFFVSLKTERNNKASLYSYLTAFDNHLKHINTIGVEIKNSVFFGADCSFKLNSFIYNNYEFPEVDAVSKIVDIQKFAQDTIDKGLGIIQTLVPKAHGTTQRIHDVSFEVIDNGTDRHITFFINVNDKIDELPQIISVCPIKVLTKGIWTSNIPFNEIFIRRNNPSTNLDIIGVAKANGNNTDEQYRKFTISPCGLSEYYKYINDYKQNYEKVSFNPIALTGNWVIVDKSQKSEENNAEK